MRDTTLKDIRAAAGEIMIQLSMATIRREDKERLRHRWQGLINEIDRELNKGGVTGVTMRHRDVTCSVTCDVTSA